MVRIKQVKAAHVGLYQCMAVNMLGSDTSKTRLTGKYAHTADPLQSPAHINQLLVILFEEV